MHVIRSFCRTLFSRRLAVSLLWTLLILCAALVFNVIAVQVLGGVSAWNAWMEEYRWHFFIWRLVLYAATAYGWWCMRERVRTRESSAQALARLRRTEIAA